MGKATTPPEFGDYIAATTYSLGLADFRELGLELAGHLDERGLG